MPNNLYILIFDRNEYFDYKQLHDYIKNDTTTFSDWWHYVKTSYILVSTYSANDIANKIMRIIPNQNFLVMKLNLNEHQGWLPKDAWDWINKYRY